MTANLLQANLLQATPFMHVRDLEATLAFFAQLGFRVGHRESNYAYVHREGAAVRILEEKDAPLGARRFRYYFDCRDVDAIYGELKPWLDTLPDGHVHGPADKPYRQRELLIRAPDGDLVAFGAAIPCQEKE